MHKIGILFDIDELRDDLYGYAAYQIFFGIISINRGKAPEKHSKSQICPFGNERVE